MYTKLFILFVLATVIFAFPIQKTYACSCAEQRSVAEEKADATAVFTGTVTDIKETGANLSVVFEADQIWKGPVSKTVTISTANDTAACGYVFERNKQYLVYASGQGQLQTSSCNRNALVSEATQDIVELGTSISVPNVTGPLNDQPTVATDKRASAGAFTVTAIVVAIALFVIKNRRKKSAQALQK